MLKPYFLGLAFEIAGYSTLIRYAQWQVGHPGTGISANGTAAISFNGVTLTACYI